MKFSIIIPIFNESENIISLLNEIKNLIDKDYKYEVVVVDDFSTDDSIIKIKKYIENYNFIKLVKNNKNMGQSYSILEGIKNTFYDTIVTIDGDGQNNPIDINKLVKIYFDNKCDLVAGIRYKRKDSYIKIISSFIANKIRSFLLNDKCRDTGCGLKVFNKNIFLSISYFNGIHRYIPALFIAKKSSIIYENVDHRPREHGKSKYGTIDRLYYAIRDLSKVKKIINDIKKENKN